MMAINGGSGDEEGHCASPTAMMANTSVSRFLKHPSGKHTVYQVDVRLPLTRQVWVLFKRYRQFVALRQQLKAECRSSTAPRNTPAKRSLTAGVGSGGTHTNHSKTSTAAKSGASMDAKMSAARVAGGAVPVPLSCSGEVMGQTASSEAVRDVLAEFTFPSKIAIAGPTALRTERRRSLNAFLQALVRIRPIPHSVAVFLDILHDNRLGLDQHGNYVQVTRADNILPIPHSPSHQRNPLVISTTEGATADGGAKADVAHPGNHSSGSLSTITVSDGSRSLPPPSPVDVGVGSATPSTFTTGPDGAHDRVRRSQNDLGIRNQEARSDLRSSVGTTAWQGVHSGGVAVMARPSRGSGTVWEAGTWSSSEQDTDEPTDCESDAESGDDDGSGAGQFCKGKEGQESFGDGDGSLPGGGGAPAPADSSKSGQSYGEGDGVSAPSDNVVVGAGQESSTSAISNNNNSDDGKGDDGIDGGPRSSNNGVFNEEVAPSASAPMIPAVDTLAISPAGLSVEKSGAALLRLRGGAGTGQLKGGGGGTDPEETKAEAESEGWSIVAAPEDVSEHDIPRNSASHDVLQEPGGNGSEKAPDEQQGGPGRGDVGGKGGERGVEERNAEMDLDQDERMIQWEFVNGFLEEVVAVVISRQHLNDAIGAEERQRSLRLSEEDRDLRMAELLSLGVDLPKDRLMMLLRYKDWGPEAATALYQALISVGKGWLPKVTPGGTVRGMENGGNTCYIDSLLFAMYATLDAFDWLLLKQLPAKDPPEVKLLQKHLRFLVHQLRQGAVIPREHSNLVRKHLRACGWQGGPSTQEDVSELFTFLVALLRCPALPLSEALFHGGKSEDSDSRVSTERALYLALPEKEASEKPLPRKQRQQSPPPRGGTSSSTGGVAAAGGGIVGSPRRNLRPSTGEKPAGKSGAASSAKEDGLKMRVTLEQILMHNFHNNRVEGLRRSVSGEKGSQPVDAWRMVSMLPFYALSGEYADEWDPSNDKHFDKVMLPMVLKRYEADQPGSTASSSQAAVGHTRKSARNVVVPLRLDCSKFMTPRVAGADKDGGAVVDHGQFILVLRSAVCHVGGESVSKGHYVAYTADRQPLRGEGAGSSLKGKKSTLSSEDETGGSAFPTDALKNVENASSGDSDQDAEASVSWLRLDDLKRDPKGRGFVEKIESVQDTNRVFSEDLGLHSYMLFYELVTLNLDEVVKAQAGESYRLIETQQDYEFAQQVQQRYDNRVASMNEWGPRGQGSDMCSIS